MQGSQYKTMFNNYVSQLKINILNEESASVLYFHTWIILSWPPKLKSRFMLVSKICSIDGYFSTWIDLIRFAIWSKIWSRLLILDLNCCSMLREDCKDILIFNLFSMFNTNLHLHTSNNVLFAQWLYLQDTAVLLWAMEQKLNKTHQKFKHKVFFILRIWALPITVFLEQNICHQCCKKVEWK